MRCTTTSRSLEDAVPQYDNAIGAPGCASRLHSRCWRTWPMQRAMNSWPASAGPASKSAGHPLLCRTETTTLQQAVWTPAARVQGTRCYVGQKLPPYSKLRGHLLKRVDTTCCKFTFQESVERLWVHPQNLPPFSTVSSCQPCWPVSQTSAASTCWCGYKSQRDQCLQSFPLVPARNPQARNAQRPLSLARQHHTQALATPAASACKDAPHQCIMIWQHKRHTNRMR